MTETLSLPQVKTTTISNDFENHISLPYNSRMIFSGKFGIGKTTFLKDFFSNSNYNSIWISPVKYSVGSNEDIFEYIKFDIILELLTKYNKSAKSKDIPEGLMIWSYLHNNPTKILESFFNTLAKFSPSTKVANEGIKLFKQNYSNYKKYKKGLIEKDKSEQDIFKDYLIGKTQKIGSIFEDDFITQAIRTYLGVIKEDDKENVLIIDDLDRLDPEHIFRILNILSVHNDYISGTYKNKFGFDKIIIVCDIESIENFYHHKYGNKADFSGYIDKFCTTKYFRFSNFEAVKHFCEENIKINGLPKHCQNTLLIILLSLLENEKITLRNLLKYRYQIEENVFIISEDLKIEKSQYCQNCCFIETSNFRIDTTDFPFLHVISILTIILGDFKYLKTCINELSEIQSKNNIPHGFERSIVDSLSLLSHLINNDSDANKLCFNLDNTKNGTGYHARNNCKHIKMPKMSFCGIPIEIILKWNKNKKYKGDVSYFNGSRLTYKSTTNARTALTSYKNIFTELHNILEYLDTENLERKI